MARSPPIVRETLTSWTSLLAISDFEILEGNGVASADVVYENHRVVL